MGFNPLMQERELEQLQRIQAMKKAAAERAANEATAAFKTLALKREVRALGYGDHGSKWGLIPERERALIEDFNKRSKHDQALILEAMVKRLEREPDKAKIFLKELDRGRDRGFSR